MNARQAKATVRAWVETNTDDWPGLRAAHLVGGITSMPDEAPFPTTKDVDVHLIVDEASAALERDGPGPNILEISYGGLAIEAGVKSLADYASAEAVLGNPEIAYHLTVDSILFDPSGWLRALREPVRRDYPRRRWVLARLAHERRGFAGALELLRTVSETWGASGEVNILGYTTTFLAAALAVAGSVHRGWEGARSSTCASTSPRKASSTCTKRSLRCWGRPISHRDRPRRCYMMAPRRSIWRWSYARNRIRSCRGSTSSTSICGLTSSTPAAR